MDIFCSERTVYPLRFIWRIFVVLVLAFLLKGVLVPEPQAYIASPGARSWVQQVQWQANQIQKAAQDLPTSIEVVIRRLFSDVRPHIEAKSV